MVVNPSTSLTLFHSFNPLFVASGRLAEMVTLWNVPLEDPRVLDLIQRILNPDPLQRPSLEEIRQHIWLNS